MTLKNNRAPLLCCFQLCAWFHCHMWIQTGVRVRKWLSWVLTSVTLTFDLWPWPFAWTSLMTMVITPENFMMIRWWEHGEKGVTDRQTDGRTDRQTDRRTENTMCRAAWSQLKITTSSNGIFIKYTFTKKKSINNLFVVSPALKFPSTCTIYYMTCPLRVETTAYKLTTITTVSRGFKLTVISSVHHNHILRNIIWQFFISLYCIAQTCCGLQIEFHIKPNMLFLF